MRITCGKKIQTALLNTVAMPPQNKGAPVAAEIGHKRQEFFKHSQAPLLQ